MQSLQSALISVSLKGISAREDQQIISPVSSSLEAAILATEVRSNVAYHKNVSYIDIAEFSGFPFLE